MRHRFCVVQAAVLVALVVTMLAACKADPKPDPETARRQAEVWGRYRAMTIADAAFDVAQLHPASERQRTSRAARLLLDRTLEGALEPPEKSPEEVPPHSTPTETEP